MILRWKQKQEKKQISDYAPLWVAYIFVLFVLFGDFISHVDKVDHVQYVRHDEHPNHATYLALAHAYHVGHVDHVDHIDHVICYWGICFVSTTGFNAGPGDNLKNKDDLAQLKYSGPPQTGLVISEGMKVQATARATRSLSTPKWAGRADTGRCALL